MLEVVVLTRRQPASNFLINYLQAIHPIRAVMYESWRADEPQSQADDLVAKVKRLKDDVVSRALYYRERLEEQLKGLRELEIDAQNAVFGSQWQQLEEPPQLEEIPDRGWDEAKQRLQQNPPDVILVFGTSLIPDSVTEIAKVASINIHTGLSPHYRGQNCTHFCIINEDFENIGVTVHIVRKAIDGGEIIVQRRPEIAPGDTEHILNAKNQRVGAEIYGELLQRLERGETFDPQGQPKDVGILLMNRALTPGHVNLVRELIKGGAVERYLRRKDRGKIRPKPIIESIQMKAAE